MKKIEYIAYPRTQMEAALADPQRAGYERLEYRNVIDIVCERTGRERGLVASLVGGLARKDNRRVYVAGNRGQDNLIVELLG